MSQIRTSEAKQFTGRKTKHTASLVRATRVAKGECSSIDGGSLSDSLRSYGYIWCHSIPNHSHLCWSNNMVEDLSHFSSKFLQAEGVWVQHGVMLGTASFFLIWGCTDPVSDPWYKAATTGCGYPCLEDRCRGLAGCVYNAALKCCEALDVLLHGITLGILREDSTRWIIDLWKSLIQIRGR